MTKALSDTYVRSIKPPAKGQITVIDQSLRNFGLRVSQGGTKTWIVLLGNGRKQTIGTYPLIGLSDARSEAKRILAEKTLGKTKPQRKPFEDCVKEYLEDCRKRLKPSTVFLYQYHLARDFPFGRTAIADITPREILNQLQHTTPSMREHSERIGRTFFSWAIRRHYLDTSPMARIAPSVKRNKRSRVLNDEEIKSLIPALHKLNNPYSVIVELLLRTGQRRAQISCLQWDWIDEKENVTHFPPWIMKTARPHILPITDTTLALIKKQPRINQYVFPAMREQVKGKPATTFAGFSKAKTALDTECPIADWTLHDLRRTHAVLLQKCQVRFEVIEAILGHVVPGVAGVYLRYDWLPEAREAELALDRYLEKLTAETT